jgi:hypothetical protein
MFIRGSVVRYVQMSKDAVDFELLQDATRREMAYSEQPQQTQGTKGANANKAQVS